MNSLYNRVYNAIAGAKVRSKELRDEFISLDQAFEILGPCAIRIDEAYTPTQDQVITYDAVDRANKVLGFDSSGNITLVAGLVSAFGGTASATVDLLTGANIASAATINLDTATGNRVHVTGVTTITAVTLTRGPRTVIFDGALTLTRHATNNCLPGGLNITTAAGDVAIYESDGTTVRCVSYMRADGTPVSRGMNSGTGSGSVTLTVASGLEQHRTFTAPGQGFTLPNATTLYPGTRYTLFNNSEYSAYVKDSTGVTRCFIAPMTGVVVTLASGATAAGTWGYVNHRMFGVTAAVEALPGSLPATTNVIQAVNLDANKTVVVIGSTTGQTVYGICYDASTGSWGSITTIDNGNSANSFVAQAVSANAFVVFSGQNSGANRVRCTGVTVAGTTLTIGATATLAISNTPTLWSAALVGSTACVGFTDGTTLKAVGVTLAGAVATFGATVTVAAAAGSATTKMDLFASGSVLVVFCNGGTGNTLVATPYSVAGTTLTVGTSATSTAGIITDSNFRTLAVGAAGWLTIGQTASDTRAHYFTLSGTAMTISTAGGTVIHASTNFNPTTQADLALVNSRALVAMSSGAASGLALITFGATTITTSNASFSTLPTGYGAPVVPYVASGTSGRVIFAATSSVKVYTVDCTNAVPVLSQRTLMGAQDLTLPAISSGSRGKRSGLTMTNASNVTAAVPAWASGAYSKRGSTLAITGAREWVVAEDPLLVGNMADAGYTNTESWVASDSAAAQSGVNQISIQKIEMATP